MIEVNAATKDRKAKVQIVDHGVGLESETLQKVFEPFFQVQKEGSSASGLGIGLALAKDLIDLHGGRISVHSPGKNKGATFTVTLPRENGAVSRAKDNSQERIHSVKPGLKLILIEDEEDIRFTMPLLLQPLQCDIKTAATGKKGWNWRQISNRMP